MLLTPYEASPHLGLTFSKSFCVLSDNKSSRWRDWRERHDQSGNPVPGVTVYIVLQGISLDGMTRRSVKKDNNGTVDFRGGFRLGAYQLYSRKDADGYPDCSDSFYAQSGWEFPNLRQISRKIILQQQSQLRWAKKL